MSLVPEETRRSLDARELSERSLRHLLKAGRDWKAHGYDAHHTLRRLLYEGKQEAFIAAKLRERYPSTWQKMDQAGLNVVQLAADIDATTYDLAPQRWITRGGERLIPDENSSDPTASDFARLLEAARLPAVMVEAERRVQVSRSIAFRYSWEENPNAPGGRPVVDLYWPSDVWIVPWALRPSSLDHALAVVAKVGSPSGAEPNEDDQVFDVWRRSVEVDPDGRPRFGPWRNALVNRKGDVLLPSSTYPGALPWSIWHQGLPEGPFIDVDRDLVTAQAALAVGWANLFFVGDNQAHDELVAFLKTGKAEGRRFVGGPGAVHLMEEGEDLKSVTRSPKIRELFEMLDRYLRTFAKTRRQSEDSYAAEPGAPMTGVSRKIKNAQHDKASRERAHFARIHEETGLMPRLVEVSDLYGGTSIGSPDNRYHFAPSQPPEFEDPRAKADRLYLAVDRGEISPARAAAENGFYPDEDAAAEAGLSRELKAKPAPTPPPMLPAPPTTDDDEGAEPVEGDEADDDGGDEG